MNTQKIKGIFLRAIAPITLLIPVKKNRVVVKSADANRYECNPKHVTEYLVKNYPDKFEIIWRFNNPEKYKYLEEKGIKVCHKNSLKAWYYMFSAKFLIDNHNILEAFPKKKNQIIINTWHGGGTYKTLLHEAKNESETEFEKVDKFISSSALESKTRINDRFNVAYEHIFEIGTPRNDVLFGDYSEIAMRVKQELNIPQDKKIIIYAPTYRDFHTNDNIIIDVKGIIDACKKRFGGEYVFLSRSHHFSHDTYNATDSESEIINVNDYDDMQDLICACDIFITDYSSIMWDVSFTDKPCFIFAYDLEEYYKLWTFFTPIEEWPFPVSHTIDELKNDILNFDRDDYLARVDQHHKDVGSFENGTACKAVAEYMLNNL